MPQFSTTNEEIVELPPDEESETESYAQGNNSNDDVPYPNVPIDEIPEIPFPNEGTGNENIKNTQTSNSEDMNNFDYDNNDSISDDDNNPIPPDYFRDEEEAQ